MPEQPHLPPPLASEDEAEGTPAAPGDPVLAERLGAPSEPLDIYLEEASHFRPISTGDIFQGVAVPGSTPEETAYDLTMLVAHPSAMRKGAALESRARAAPITPVQGMSTRKWTAGHHDVFPLPLLAQVTENNGFRVQPRGWAALLHLAAPIETHLLDIRRRVACLSPKGVHLLLQKLVLADTRFAVREDTLAAAFAAKLEEIEMLQTWNEELVAPLVDQGRDPIVELASAAHDFEAAFSAPREPTGRSLRDMLESRTDAGEAHRLLVAEIRRRRSAEPPPAAL